MVEKFTLSNGQEYEWSEEWEMTTKFKSRYVLAEGYPWVIDYGNGIVMHNSRHPMGYRRKLDWPKELWSEDLPKYRLVLELVE